MNNTARNSTTINRPRKTMRTLTKEGEFQARAFGLRISYFDYGRMSLAGTLLEKMAVLHVVDKWYQGGPTRAWVDLLNDEGKVTKGNGEPLTIEYVHPVLLVLEKKGLVLRKGNCWTINPRTLDQIPFQGRIS